MKKKGITFKVILIVFLIIFILLCSCLITNWDNIVAVVNGLRYSVEEIDNIRIENQKEVDEELSKYPDLNFRNLTEEEIKALSEGKISQDDVPYLVTGRKVFANGVVMTNEEYEKFLNEEGEQKENSDDINKGQKGNDNKNGDTKQPTQKPDVSQSEPEPPKTNPELEAVLEKFFVLKATFLADIEKQVDGMIAEYKSIPKKERTKAVKSEYANKAISLMAATEPVYDSQFEVVVSELEVVIEKINGDKNLVATVRDAYKKEKAAIKAKYVSKARKHL